MPLAGGKWSETYKHNCQSVFESQNDTDDVIWQFHSQRI